MPYVNAIICPECNTAAYSYDVHDFSYCACENFYIDGGDNYIKIGGKNLEEIQVIKLWVDQETIDAKVEKRNKENDSFIKNYKKEKSNVDPIFCALLNALGY